MAAVMIRAGRTVGMRGRAVLGLGRSRGCGAKAIGVVASPKTRTTPLATVRHVRVESKTRCMSVVAAAGDSSSDKQTAAAADAQPKDVAVPSAVRAETTTTSEPEVAGGGDDGAANKGGDGGGGGGGEGGEGSGDGGDDDEALYNLSQAEEIVAAKGLKLPADFAAAAAAGGIRSSALNKWVELQGNWLTAFVSRLSPIFRDRLIADDRFLFLVGAEVLIDSGCATIAEVRKRGDEFWDEFEFYLSDMLVGLVMDVFIITCISPVAVIGKQAKASKATGLSKITAGFPSNCFEKSIPGVKEYSLGQRVGCVLEKAVQYGTAGLISGFIGQAIANQLMLLKRQVHGTSEKDVPIPPVGLTGLTWGVFMAGSSNLRYQTVYGIERLISSSPIAANRRLNNALSIIVRYGNNVIGGENFIDHARFFGCQ